MVFETGPGTVFPLSGPLIQNVWGQLIPNTLGKVMIQLHATHMIFIRRLLSQHVSGINTP